MSIRFMKFYVTDGAKRVRVTYHLGEDKVTIYEKNYGRDLGDLLPDVYTNDTDIMTDYFDYGRAVLSSDHPLYSAARTAAEAFLAGCRTRHEAPRVTTDQVKVIEPNLWEVQSRGWHFKIQYRNKPGYKSWIVTAARDAESFPRPKFFSQLTSVESSYSNLRGIASIIAPTADSKA